MCSYFVCSQSSEAMMIVIDRETTLVLTEGGDA